MKTKRFLILMILSLLSLPNLSPAEEKCYVEPTRLDLVGDLAKRYASLGATGIFYAAGFPIGAPPVLITKFFSKVLMEGGILSSENNIITEGAVKIWMVAEAPAAWFWSRYWQSRREFLKREEIPCTELEELEILGDTSSDEF